MNEYGSWSSHSSSGMAAEEVGSDPAAQNAFGSCTRFPVKFVSATESQVDDFDADYANFSKIPKHRIQTVPNFCMDSENSDSETAAQNCNGSNYSNSKDGMYHREKTELSDVLFSFKASPQMGLTVYPGQVSPVSYANSYANSYAQPAQLFPQSGYSPNYCLDQSFGSGHGHGHNTSPAAVIGSTTSPNFSSPFPAMSVNVSMNMTMGYLPPPPPDGSGIPHHHHYHQVQWTSSQAAGGQSSPSTSYPAYGSTGGTAIQTQSLCAQPYNTTYSFAADFRSEPPLEAVRAHWLPSTSMLATANGAVSAASRAHHHHLSNGGGGSAGGSKHHLHSYRTRSSESDSPSSKDFVLGKQNLCRICGKAYARPSTLKTHLRTHSGEKPYRCTECYKSFSQAANLTAHVRTHSGEKPFYCTVCDRKFSQSSSVTTHMRTHSGEKPYRCRLCKKAFSDSSTLTKHLRIHSGEKPYQCKLCLLRFSQSGNLNRHMRVHANNSNINGGSGSGSSAGNNHYHG